jgi:hypothetical protein
MLGSRRRRNQSSRLFEPAACVCMSAIFMQSGWEFFGIRRNVRNSPPSSVMTFSRIWPCWEGPYS